MSSGEFNREETPDRGVHINSGSGSQNNNCGSGEQIVVGVINITSEQRHNLLYDLSTTDPGDDKTRIAREKGGLIPGLNDWFFDLEEYTRWHRRPQKRLLWITGNPGKGKTMLICDVIEKLEKQNFEPVYFFCQARDARLNTANAVLRGLLYSFMSNNPSSMGQIHEKYKRRGKVIFEDTNSWDVLTGTIKGIIYSGAMSKSVIVIDALDECVEWLDQLLDFLIDISATCKAIVSSRNCSHIKNSLAAACDKITISLEDNESSVGDAVHSYIDRKVSELAALRGYNDTKHAEVFTYLSTNANNTFLWASLACQHLVKNSMPLRDPMATLEEFSPGLDSVYDRMCSQVIASSRDSLCIKLLATVCTLYEPFTLQDMAILLERDEGSLERAVDECCGLLVVSNSVISFVHQSAQKFWTERVQEVMLCSASHEHGLILTGLVKIMSGTLRRDLYDLEHPGAAVGRGHSSTKDSSATVRYPCLFWADHFIKAGTMNSKEQHLVFDFLRKHVLHWIEALCHLRQISKGIEDLANILSSIQSPNVTSSAGTRDLFSLVYDAYRLMLYFRPGIENNPLQIYHSALSFSPKRSVIANLFRHRELQGVEVLATRQDEWGECLLSLEINGTILSPVTFSPDGTMVVTSYDSKMMQLWNAGTGEKVRRIEGHSSKVCSVAFTQDGSTVISGSQDGSIRLWDTLTGKCKSKRVGHTTAVTVICVANSGTSFISGSVDKSVKIWDLKRARYHKALPNVDGHILTLSHDGMFLATPSASGQIRLWNAKNLTREKKLSGHSGKIKALAFSGDVGSLASATSNDTIKLWDLKTEKSRVSIKSGEVSSIVFSADNTQLLSNRAASEVWFWDVSTGQNVRIIRGHAGSFQSLSLSGNGEMLVSIAGDKTAKLWEVDPCRHYSCQRMNRSISTFDADESKSGLGKQTSDAIHKFFSHIKWIPPTVHFVNYSFKQINSLMFSSNGEHIAIADGATVYLWDALTGQCIRAFEPFPALKDYSMFTVAFRGKHLLLAGYYDSQIFVWNISTRMLITSFRDHKDASILAFSRDGAKIASSHGKRIRIWDAFTGGKEKELKIQSAPEGSIRFSESGAYLHVGEESFSLATEAVGGSSNSKVLQAATTEPHRFRLRADDGWVAKQHKLFLWLPPEYRSSIWDTSRSVLALGCGSRFIFIRFL